MKRLAAFVFILIAAGSCNSFQHAHYSRLKKIPVTGIPSKEKINLPVQQALASEAVTHSDPAPFPVHAPAINPVPAPVRKVPPVLKNGEKKITASVKKARQFTTPASLERPDKEFGILASVFIFLFASFLVFSGGALIVFGLLYSVNWMILAGLLYFLIGAGPVWGLLKSLFSYHRKHDPEELQRRQM